MRISRPTLLFVLILGSLPAFSQYSEFKYKRKNHSSDLWYTKTTKDLRYLSGGLGVNLLCYFGDLTPTEHVIKNAIRVTRPGISAFAAYNLSNMMGMRVEIGYGRIIGDDFNTSPNAENSSKRKYVRNLSFRNDVINLTIQGYYHILGDPFEYYKRRDLNLYVLGGLTAYYSNPKTMVPETSLAGIPFENAGEWVALRPLGTEGQNSPELGKKYSAVQFGIPLGGGIKIRLGYKIDLLLEASLTYILSDYIDDVGSSYVDLGALESDLAKALSDRSQEVSAVMKNEMRDRIIIEDYTRSYEYTSEYDGRTYSVYQGFGHEGATRGGRRNDLIGTTSFKISYIFTN